MSIDLIVNCYFVAVTESMATFLALEELCDEETPLTPRQTEAVFKASKSMARKHQQPQDNSLNKGSIFWFILYCQMLSLKLKNYSN